MTVYMTQKRWNLTHKDFKGQLNGSPAVVTEAGTDYVEIVPVPPVNDIAIHDKVRLLGRWGHVTDVRKDEVRVQDDGVTRGSVLVWSDMFYKVPYRQDPLAKMSFYWQFDGYKEVKRYRMMTPIIYTIGYGGTMPDKFFDCIEKKGIEVVIDVRTKPRGYLQVYSAPTIGKRLANSGIDYINDKRLGGLDTIHDTEFTAGIEQVMAMAEDVRVCLMCSEKDPKKCHRYSKLSPELEARGAEMSHIVIENDKTVKKSSQTTLV